MSSGLFPDRLVDAETRDRAFLMELVYGAVRRRETLDWMVRQLVERPPEGPVRALLHVGLEQLMFMERVDAFAAVHETVEAARELECGWAVGLINGVLRSAQRRRSELLIWLSRMPPAVRLSHPVPLLERWERQYGQTRAHRLCEWNNLPAEVCLRRRPCAPPMEEFLARLRGAGFEGRPHPFSPDRCAVLGRGQSPAALPGYEAGWFYVQDPSTMIAPDMLAPTPGESVLDACAAPGGKTAMLAERMDGRGVLIACDLHDDRLARLRENLARMGCDWVRVVQADATAPDDVFLPALPAGTPRLFDAILVDAPCTNTGVIRRRPDARWAFSQRRLDDLTRLQAALLARLADRVRPGGRMVYSTCSLEREENQLQTRAFLSARPDFTLAAERLLCPPDTATDGAYAALLRRAAPPSTPSAARAASHRRLPVAHRRPIPARRALVEASVKMPRGKRS